MREDDFEDFAQLLTYTFDLLGKTPAAKVISDGAMAIFFQVLADYPLALVRTALITHCDRGTYTPIPKDIIGYITEAANADSRPGAEEAFSLALTTSDEQKTVVWTEECAQAWAACKPVLDAAGVISARKTFLEVYERLVAAARKRQVPVKWFTSPGLDKDGYLEAVKVATTAGLLVAPKVDMPLLEAPGAEPAPTLSPRQQLDYIKKMMIEGMQEKQRRADAAIDARIQAEEDTSASIRAKVDQYQVDKGERGIVDHAGDIEP